MRMFELHRDVDAAGVSGTGVVAEGVEWTDGTVTLCWLGDYHTIVNHPRGLESVAVIHGHGGLTRIVFKDAEPAPVTDAAPEFWDGGAP